MTVLVIALGAAKLTLDAVDEVSAALVTWMFPVAEPAEHEGDSVAAVIAHLGDDRFTVTNPAVADQPTFAGERAATVVALSGQIAELLADRVVDGTTFHAAAVQRGGRAVLLPGVSGAGKTTAALRLASAGFGLLTDELAWLSTSHQVSGLLRPLGVKRPIDPDLMSSLHLPLDGPDVLQTRFVRLLDARTFSGERESEGTDPGSHPEPELAALVFPVHDPERPPAVTVLSPTAAAERLLGSRWVPPGRRTEAFGAIAAAVRRVPAVELVGEALDHVVGVVDALLSDTPIGDLPRPRVEPTRSPRPSLEELDPLSRLAIWHGSDSWSAHRHTSEYHRLLRSRRAETRRVLVVVHPDGRSDPRNLAGTLQMWRDYFPEAIVWAVGEDLEELAQLDLGPRITLRSISTGDRLLAELVMDGLPPFDIVIDAGSCEPVDVLASFDLLFGTVRDGGYYAIEDLQTSYWSGVDPVGQTTRVSAIDMVKELVDRIHTADARTFDEGSQLGAHAGSIRGITVTRDLCIVERGANRARSVMANRLDEPQVQHTLAVLHEARQRLPDGRAEVALARLHHRLHDDDVAVRWARSALEAGSTDHWAMQLVRIMGLDPLPPDA